MHGINKINAILVREPTNGQYGKLIRENARQGFRFPPEKEKDLFMKDRMENVTQTINPALHKGQVVLMDRYYISTMAYQGARGLDPERIRLENEQFAPVPDILFILDIAVSLGLNRIARNRNDQFDDFEKQDYLEHVRHLFLNFQFRNMHIIQADQPIDTIEKQVMSYIKKLLGDLIQS